MEGTPLTFFEKFKSWLFEPRATVSLEGAPDDLEPIDVERLAKELNLRAEAKRLGEGGVPNTESTTLSGNELKAIAAIEAHRVSYHKWATRRLESIDRDIAKSDVRDSINQALRSVDQFVNKADALLTRNLVLLESLKTGAKKRKSELQKFKEEHDLEEDAHLTSNAHKFKTIGLLVFLILVESFFNGEIFQRGLSGGLSEGIFYAILFALINVTASFYLGLYAGYLKSKRTEHRYLGALSICLAAVIALIISFSLSHFRMALSAQVEEPMLTAWETLTLHTFDIKGLETILLFSVTLAFAALTFRKATDWDESYPGYAKRARLYVDAEEEFEKELELIQEELQKLKDEQINLIQRSIEKIQVSIASLEQKIVEKRNAGHRVNTLMEGSRSAALSLLMIFRNENELYRGDHPRPKYFNREPALQDIKLPDFGTEEAEQLLSEQQSLFTVLVDKSGELKSEIDSAFNSKHELLIPLRGRLVESYGQI